MGEGQSVWIFLSDGDADYLDEFVHGFGLTLQISFGSYFIGFLLGLGGAGRTIPAKSCAALCKPFPLAKSRRQGF